MDKNCCLFRSVLGGEGPKFSVTAAAWAEKSVALSGAVFGSSSEFSWTFFSPAAASSRMQFVLARKALRKSRCRKGDSPPAWRRTQEDSTTPPARLLSLLKSEML